jgi:hypothetical protein
VLGSWRVWIAFRRDDPFFACKCRRTITRMSYITIRREEEKERRRRIRDGSIRADVGDPLLLAPSLWAFTHRIIQIAMAKGTASPGAPRKSSGPHRRWRHLARSRKPV